MAWILRVVSTSLLLLWFGGTGSPAAGQEPECLVIEDFARAKVGEFPTDWKPRRDAGKTIYAVREEGGLRFLRAVSKGLGIRAALEYAWDLAKYPMLVWSWRPRDFPRGADESDSSKNDSVLAVYMLVPYSRITGPKAVKYIWSERVPVDTNLTSNMGLTHETRSSAQGDYANFRACRR